MAAAAATATVPAGKKRKGGEAKKVGEGAKVTKKKTDDGSGVSPKAKSDLDVKLQALKVLKTKWNLCLTEASNLYETIHSNVAWAMFKPAVDLKLKCDAVKAFRSRSEFWEFASMNDSVKANVR